MGSVRRVHVGRGGITAMVATVTQGPRRRYPASALHSRSNHGAKLLKVHWLGQIVEGPRAQGLHRVLCGAICRHHNATLSALLDPQILKQFHAKTIRQAHVGDHRIELVVTELFTRLLQRGRGLDTVSLPEQRQLIQSAKIGFVINNKNGCGRSSHGNSGQTTTVSNSVADSEGRVVRRKATVKALPPISPRVVARATRW